MWFLVSAHSHFECILSQRREEKCVHTKEVIQLLTVIIEYWKMLLKSTVFRGHTLKDCLQVIRKDIITVWNFNDPDQVRFLPLASLARADWVWNVF